MLTPRDGDAGARILAGMSPPAAPLNRTVELLAPAGDWDCARAAVENGADAIYFGLDCGFNARYRAKNFGIPDLPELTKFLRRRGVRGYVTMNTLVFPSELPGLVEVIEQVASSGVDAVLVQDFGVAQIGANDLPGTRNSCVDADEFDQRRNDCRCRTAGTCRAWSSRANFPLPEIRQIAADTDMPLEVFIHGALCVAYSGQCLTSESLGGRSANRGQCAQACRLPYELICDGQDRNLEEVRYLLSPQDLAGYAAIPDLIDAGVQSLKIEGRLKTAEYVANITGHYRRAIDEALADGTVTVTADDKRDMELSFSRGFSPGWLAGNDHKRLVPGLSSAKRGIELGTIIEIDSPRIKIGLDAPVALGDGLSIPASNPEQTQGGRIYSLENDVGQPAEKLAAGQVAWIGFGRGEVDLADVELDATVFKTDDPQLNKRLRHSFSGDDPKRRRAVDIDVFAETGKPLRLVARLGAVHAEVSSDQDLNAARTQPADAAMLRDKLARLGGTPFVLGEFQATITAAPMVPVSSLNRLRRQLVDQLLTQLDRPPARHINAAAGHQLIATQHLSRGSSEQSPQLAVLCRNLEQLQSAAALDVSLLYVDFPDIRQYGEAVQIARRHEKAIGIATVRMQKPGELGLLRVLLRHQPDLILARNLAAIRYFQDQGVPTVADFSLNTANHLSADWLQGLGVRRLTASYDLNREQLFDLVGSMPSTCWEIVIHQHMPMFHMEHCVFCAVLSPGTDKTNCGRPCDRHVVQLRDRVGAEHTLQADVACRNTLYNAVAQSGAETVGELIAAGTRWFRVELLNETAKQTQTTISLYRQLLRGELSAQNVWRKLQATNRVGVTRGTLESQRNPLAIL